MREHYPINEIQYLCNCLEKNFICCKEGIVEVSGRFISTSFTLKVGDLATLKEISVTKEDDIVVILESTGYKYRLSLDDFTENFELAGAEE